MKKIKRTFDITKWKTARTKSNARKREVVFFFARHPVTWFVLTIAVVYTHAWWIS